MRRLRPARRLLADALLVAGVAIVVGLAGINFLAWRGDLPDDSGSPAGVDEVTAEATDAGQVSPSDDATSNSGGVAAAGTGLARVVVVASRGDSYLEVRAGSDEGQVQWSGMLEVGETATAKGRRLWMRMGTPENVDVTVNSEPFTSLPVAASDVVVTAEGVRVVRLG